MLVYFIGGWLILGVILFTTEMIIDKDDRAVFLEAICESGKSYLWPVYAAYMLSMFFLMAPVVVPLIWYEKWTYRNVAPTTNIEWQRFYIHTEFFDEMPIKESDWQRNGF